MPTRQENPHKQNLRDLWVENEVRLRGRETTEGPGEAGRAPRLVSHKEGAETSGTLSLAPKDTREHYPHPWPRVLNPGLAGPHPTGHAPGLYLPEAIHPESQFHRHTSLRPTCPTTGPRPGFGFHLCSAPTLQQFYVHMYSSLGVGETHPHTQYDQDNLKSPTEAATIETCGTEAM